jgi:NTP pyrophosphatase (non-canonical NTP hydrolase)
MELNYFKKQTMDICRKKGWTNVSIEYLWMFLIEEVGELASAIRRHKKQFPDRKKINIEGEIMDVLSYLFQISDIFEIDMDKAWEKHINSQNV